MSRPAWLLRPAPWPLRAVAAGLTAVVVVATVRRGGRLGMDNAFVVKAARALLDGGAPYADKRFLYLPGAVLAAVPEALLPARWLPWLVPAAGVGLVLLGWFLSLRIFGVRADSRLAVLVVAALPFFQPFRNLVTLGNWTLASVVALPLALLLACRARWVAAGAVIGCVLALKPMLLPVLLLFVLARRWGALAVASTVPVGVSLLAALAMPRPGMFLTRTLPFLLRGQDAFARPYDASLGAVLARLGVAPAAAYGLAVAAAAAGVACACLRWRRADDGPLRLVETAAMLLLAAFLVSRPSFDHYLLVVLGPLLASAAVPGSVPRTAWFWAALVPQVAGLDWPYLEDVRRRAFKDAAMLWTLAAVVACACLRRPAGSGADRAPGSGADRTSGGGADRTPAPGAF
ncbi:glycosyltransferase 87 family protein [Streptomyces niger]|uniref:glycosyltransferase 87 family protein n=1 Tax=Streptomyces niger TaxID=66373 RepID=UPI000A774AD5